MMNEKPVAAVKVTGKWYQSQGCSVYIDYIGDDKLDIRHQSLMILEMILVLVESWNKLRKDNVMKFNFDKKPEGWKIKP
jgi:hypothetical protein